MCWSFSEGSTVMRILEPFLGPLEAKDKVGSAVTASEKKCILTVGVLTRLELVQGRYYDGFQVMIYTRSGYVSLQAQFLSMM
jgi:hypothetical protein